METILRDCNKIHDQIHLYEFNLIYINIEFYIEKSSDIKLFNMIVYDISLYDSIEKT